MLIQTEMTEWCQVWMIIICKEHKMLRMGHGKIMCKILYQMSKVIISKWVHMLVLLSLYKQKEGIAVFTFMFYFPDIFIEWCWYLCLVVETLMYKVRQFNIQSGPVKAKFAYLCTSSCCRLRMLSLWSYALCEMMVQLPETVLKIIFRNTSQ
jgi:hypothetical protein